GARRIAACPRRSTRYCARLAGPSCSWMSQRIIIETLPASDRSRWIVTKTDLSPQRVVGDREPGPAHTDSGYSNRLRGLPAPECDLAEISRCTKSRWRSHTDCV